MSTLNSNEAVTPPVFAVLLADFARFAGVAGATAGALGLEFEAGAHTVRVLPHPANADWLIAEVDVVDIGQATSTAYEALHRVNHAARLEHGWTATCGEEGPLVMHTARPVATMTAADLEGLLVDGLERAEALATLWRELRNTGAGESASLAADIAAPSFAGYIRG